MPRILSRNTSLGSKQSKTYRYNSHNCNRGNVGNSTSYAFSCSSTSTASPSTVTTTTTATTTGSSSSSYSSSPTMPDFFTLRMNDQTTSSVSSNPPPRGMSELKGKLKRSSRIPQELSVTLKDAYFTFPNNHMAHFCNRRSENAIIQPMNDKPPLIVEDSSTSCSGSWGYFVDFVHYQEWELPSSTITGSKLERIDEDYSTETIVTDNQRVEEAIKTSR
jgi:hypothetical protein